AIIAYFQGLQVGQSKREISTTISNVSFLRGPYMAKVIRNWGKYFLNNRTLPPGASLGRGRKIKCLLADQEVAAECQAFFRSIPPPQRSVHRLKIYIENEIYPKHLGILDRLIISEKTCHRYLTAWGFHKTAHRQDVYYDGHERDDVKDYRNKWSNLMMEWRSKMREYDQDGIEHLPTLADGEKEIV
ncbi:hypothetical protein V1509DRAFT_554157, partial [Lipomyces kononenkoae]